jgi:hypothetical protein
VDKALDVERLADAAAVNEAWVEPVAALSHLSRLDVDEEAAARLAHGRPVRAPVNGGDEGRSGSTIAVSCAGRLVAVGERADGWLRPRKVFG